MCLLLFIFFLKAILALSSKYESLTHIYETYNEGPGLHHWQQHGPVYDENIHQLREAAVDAGRKVKMLEIGVQSGGSTRVWKRYFRGTLSYVGIDINPLCKQFESLGEGITIQIGSQLDKSFLSEICSTYGPFDLIVDDGGHTNKMIRTSLASLWGCMKDKGVYVIQDLHALNMGSKFLEKNDTVTIFEEIGRWMRVRSPGIEKSHIKHAELFLSKLPGWHLKKQAFYDSIIFLHYGEEIPWLKRLIKGSQWLPLKWEGALRSVDHGCEDCCVGCYDD